MYEHPIKRAGLSMNRILYSNTKMVMQGFPALKQQQFNLSFKFKTYENGKIASIKRKCPLRFPRCPKCSHFAYLPSTCVFASFQNSQQTTWTMCCPPETPSEYTTVALLRAQ